MIILLIFLLSLFLFIGIYFGIVLPYKDLKESHKKFEIGDIVTIVDLDNPFKKCDYWYLIIDKSKGNRSNKIYYLYQFCNEWGEIKYNTIYSGTLEYHTKVGHIK